MRKQPPADRLWNIFHELMVHSYFAITENDDPDILTIESDSIVATKINGDKFASALIKLYTDGISLSKTEIEKMILDNPENS